jgi:hypothetical protein
MEPARQAEGDGVTAAVREGVRRWTRYYTARVLWAAEPVEAAAPPPSEASVIDALEVRAVEDLAARGGRAHALAAVVTQLDAVARLRREVGARAGAVDGAVDGAAAMVAVIARRVYAERCAVIDAAPAPRWAVALAEEIAARGESGEAAARVAGSGPPCGGRVAELRWRLVQALREAEVATVAALWRRAARGGDVGDELEQLGAIGETLDMIGVTRGELYEGERGTR